MTSKHTPGPWLVEHDDRPGMEWNIHIVVTNTPHTRICFMAHRSTEDNSECEANAHLIAAAPELAEALEQLYQNTADYIRVNKLGDVHHNKDMQDARAALKKARP